VIEINNTTMPIPAILVTNSRERGGQTVHRIRRVSRRAGGKEWRSQDRGVLLDRLISGMSLQELSSEQLVECRYVGAGARACEECQRVDPSETAFLIRQRRPHIHCLQLGSFERRNHTHNRVHRIVNVHRLSDNARIGCEVCSPVLLANHGNGHRGTAQSVFVRREQAPACGVYAEHRKKSGCDKRDEHPFLAGLQMTSPPNVFALKLRRRSARVRKVEVFR
jgi:hypothetical protein